MDRRQVLAAAAIAVLGGSGISLAPEVVKFIDDLFYGIVVALYELVPPE